MLLALKKEVEETIELNTPAWFVNKLGFYAHVTEGGDLIEVYGNTVTLKEASPATEVAIAQIARDYYGCSEQQFKEALDKRLFKFEEKYTNAT
jgi:hypothetical protein